MGKGVHGSFGCRRRQGSFLRGDRDGEDETAAAGFFKYLIKQLSLPGEKHTTLCPKTGGSGFSWSWWLSWYRIHLQCRRPRFNSWVKKIPWRRDGLPTPVFLGFPGGSEAPPAMQEMWVQSLGWDDSLEEGGHGNPLQYSCLENPHGQRSLQATVHGVAKSRKRLSN